MSRTRTKTHRGTRAAAIALSACLALATLGGCQAEQPKEADFSSARDIAKLETYERACVDDTMPAAARDRAKVLLEQYVKNVGANLGETYTVKWADAE